MDEALTAATSSRVSMGLCVRGTERKATRLLL